MKEKINSIPEAEPESIRLAMTLAWRDHHHARDQTWKTVQLAVGFAAGLLAFDIKYEYFWATFCAFIPLFITCFSGIYITWHHRLLEIRKFIHIMNCEEKLNLHRYDLIPLREDEIDKFVRIEEYQEIYGLSKNELKNIYCGKDKNENIKDRIKQSEVVIPKTFTIWDVFNIFQKQSTALFILRTHMMILIFGFLILLWRFKIDRQINGIFC